MRLFSPAFWKDFAITSATEASVVVCGLLAPALVARLGGMQTLGAYLLVRRLSSSLVPPLSLGLAVALPRYLPSQKGDPGIQVRWSVLAISITVGFGLFCALLVSSFRASAARLLLGSVTFSALLIPLALLTFAGLLHAILYGHYRGMVQMKHANTLQALNFGILPVLALLQIKKTGLAGAISLTAYLIISSSAVFLLPIVRQLLTTQVAVGWTRHAWRHLFSYGLSRVPSFWLSGLLLTLGPIWLAHKVSMADVGIYSLALSFMRMIGAFFAPFGLLLLPRLADARQQGTHQGVLRDLQLLLRTALLFALFVSLQASVLSDTLLTIWLGSAPPSIRLLFVPLIFVLPCYLAYEVLRNPIDAASAVPYNAVGIGVALLVLLLSALGNSATWIVLGQCCGFVILGGLSIVFLAHLYKLRGFASAGWVGPAAYCCATGILTWFIQREYHPRILFLGPYEVFLFGGFVAFLLRASKAQKGHEIQAQGLSDTEFRPAHGFLDQNLS